MMYLNTGPVCWADEFDVDFGELIDENTYKKYEYAKKVLKEYIDSYCFGTNEDFEEFDYLGFSFIEVPDEDVKVLKKYSLPTGYTFVDRFFDLLDDKLTYLFPEDCYQETMHIVPNDTYTYSKLNDDILSCSFEKFKYYIDKYAKIHK